MTTRESWFDHRGHVAIVVGFLESSEIQETQRTVGADGSGRFDHGIDVDGGVVDDDGFFISFFLNLSVAE